MPDLGLWRMNMGADQIYNPMAGINRMISDIENTITPILFRMQPILRIMGSINTYLVAAVFLLLILYMKLRRKHSIIKKLKQPSNYIIVGAMLIAYVFLSVHKIELGPYISLDIGVVIMPIIAKTMGPLVAAIFGIFQYAGLFLFYDGMQFSITSMLLAGISGILYAWFIYDKRTRYLRCLWAKLTVNIVCNILLVSVVTTDVMTTEVAQAYVHRIISNIFLVPVQALIIFIALKLYKKAAKVCKQMFT